MDVAPAHRGGFLYTATIVRGIKKSRSHDRPQGLVKALYPETNRLRSGSPDDPQDKRNDRQYDQDVYQSADTIYEYTQQPTYDQDHGNQIK